MFSLRLKDFCLAWEAAGCCTGRLEKVRLKLDLSRCFWDGRRFTVEKEGEAKDDEEEKGPFVTLQLLFRRVAAAVTAAAAAAVAVAVYETPMLM
ncbi:hypothetical protein V1478_000525 [Vespula squamosa]|uniref:Uncharacterized protein n=1 Tax=Vespula squamosa TaxID=30214 RepID=A0ABD2C6L2_VESSQ